MYYNDDYWKFLDSIFIVKPVDEILNPKRPNRKKRNKKHNSILK